MVVSVKGIEFGRFDRPLMLNGFRIVNAIAIVSKVMALMGPPVQANNLPAGMKEGKRA